MNPNMYTPYPSPRVAREQEEKKEKKVPLRANVEKLAYLESIKFKSTDMKQSFGCIIVNKKKIVSKGTNFHSFGKTQTCSCHAEMNAIYRHLKLLGIWKNFQKMLDLSYKTIPIFHKMKGGSVISTLDEKMKGSPKKLKNVICSKMNMNNRYKIYVYRFTAAGKICNARPCAECTRWVYVAEMLGIYYDIYYTDDDEKLKTFDYFSTQYVPKDTYFSKNTYHHYNN